ncbi:hypothetical protein ACC719_37160, partial [Rhizobium ruizarguesonis]
PFFARTPKTRLTITADRYWSERPDHLPDMPGPVPDYFDFRSERLLPQRWINNAFERTVGFKRRLNSKLRPGDCRPP